MNIKSLEREGCVALKYPKDLRAAVLTAVDSWKAFCDLPSEVKTLVGYNAQGGGTGVGYELKIGTGPAGDRKENFDVALSGLDWLTAREEDVGQIPVGQFIGDATRLVALVKPTITKFAREVEREYSLVGFAREVEESEAGFFIRFIHYPGDRKVNDETATAHVDQSCFTLHLFESHAGLERLPYKGDWVPMPVSEGKTVIIPAMQMQLRSEGRLRATFHRVVANPETAISGRYSAVCFIQLRNTPKYDKEKHGRLQERAPGFNYAMPHADFAKLFK